MATPATPTAPALSFAERNAKLAADRAKLRATHEAKLDALQETITTANGVFASMSSKLEADANEAQEAAHRALQTKAAEILDPLVAEFVAKGTRASALAVASAFRDLHAEKLATVGRALDEHELAMSFMAQVIARDPSAQAAFGHPDTLMCVPSGCGDASYLAMKTILETSEPALAQAALGALELAVSRASHNTPVAQGTERFTITRFGGGIKARTAALAACGREERAVAEATQWAKIQAALRKVPGWSVLDSLGVLTPVGEKTST